MTGRIYRPEQQHPEPYQQDLNPDASKGMNWGDVGPHPEKHRARSAKDHKDVHQLLRDFDDDELRRIPLLPTGSRLETNATYVNLRDPQRREFTAGGDEVVSDDDWVVPKSEVDYQLWNRLIGVDDPARTGEG